MARSLDTQRKTFYYKEVNMNTLKSVFRGICEALQFVSLLVLSGLTIVCVTEFVLELLTACGVQHIPFSAKTMEMLLYLIPVLAGILYWRSRKEYWQ